MIRVFPNGQGATIELATRADVAEFFAALNVAQVKGVAEPVVVSLLALLSHADQSGRD